MVGFEILFMPRGDYSDDLTLEEAGVGHLPRHSTLRGGLLSCLTQQKIDFC